MGTDKYMQRLRGSLLVPWVDNLEDWWCRVRKRLDKASRAGFDCIVKLIAWCLWKQCNTRVFGSGIVRNELGTVDFIFQELSVWAKAGVSGVQHLCVYQYVVHLYATGARRRLVCSVAYPAVRCGRRQHARTRGDSSRSSSDVRVVPSRAALDPSTPAAKLRTREETAYGLDR
ncbi:hypothetical protein VPH35_053730 [Triticum aestivum]|uniref:Uncharacterized protein n=1 Tax=Triticum aestivum TaxID=4565 RepID=A0A077S4F7_WHEAT|nr:unnamed protein product [Triticum aestivum]